ncbi:MAG: DUF45 domain-containing protein, partial [Candidatus Kapabacteria bacterium]|nr:DUF45 domain-containing protein [Candidatus Kapabacteria bacterium]
MQIDINIIRSDRQTFSIEIGKDAELVVRAPRTASKTEINKIIDKKRVWIEKHLSKMISRKHLHKEKLYASGEKFYYFGKTYPLTFSYDISSAIMFDGEKFIVKEDYRDQSALIFEAWYKTNARNYIRKRTHEIASQLNLQYEQVKISSARKRWGSCSTKKTLNFTWRLLQADKKVIDYIIVHE